MTKEVPIVRDPTTVIESAVSGSLPPLSTSLLRNKARDGGMAKALAKVGSANRVSEGVTLQEDAPARTVVTQTQTLARPPANPPSPKRRTLADIVESQQPARQNPVRHAVAQATPATGASLAGRVLSGMFKPRK